MQPNKLRRLSNEPLEPRLPLASTVLDLNPGPYSSEIAIIRQVDDWLYLDATVGDDRRLLKTDGETVVDLGPALEFKQSIERGQTSIGVGPQGVLSFDFETDTVSTISTEPGAKVLDGTVHWFTEQRINLTVDPDHDLYRIIVDYDDIDGRSIKVDELVPCFCDAYDFHPIAVAGESVIVTGTYGWPRTHEGVFAFTGNEPAAVVLGDQYREVDGESLYGNGTSWLRADGSVAFAAGQIEAGFDGGLWLFQGDTLNRYADGELTEWGSTTGQPWQPNCVSYAVVAPDYAVMQCDTDIWDRQPYLFTADGVSFLRGEFPFDPATPLYVDLGVIAGQEVISGPTGLMTRSGGVYVPWTEPTGKTFTVEYHFLTGQEPKVVTPEAGDSNHDGAFDSGDLVLLFQLGEYEDDIVGNSSWVSGDFNGDGEFDTADLVAAFALGTYRT